jgi:hypothetical protein
VSFDPGFAARFEPRPHDIDIEELLPTDVGLVGIAAADVVAPAPHHAAARAAQVIPTLRIRHALVYQDLQHRLVARDHTSRRIKASGHSLQLAHCRSHLRPHLLDHFLLIGSNLRFQFSLPSGELRLDGLERLVDGSLDDAPDDRPVVLRQITGGQTPSHILRPDEVTAHQAPHLIVLHHGQLLGHIEGQTVSLKVMTTSPLLLPRLGEQRSFVISPFGETIFPDPGLIQVV